MPEEQQPSYMRKPLKELGIGTYNNIATVSVQQVTSFQNLQSHSQTFSLIPKPLVSFPDLQSHSKTSSLIPKPSVSFQNLQSHSQSFSLIPRSSVSFPDLQSHSQTFSLFPRLEVSFPDPLYGIALVACSTKGSFLLLYALPIFFHSLSLPLFLSPLLAPFFHRRALTHRSLLP